MERPWIGPYSLAAKPWSLTLHSGVFSLNTPAMEEDADRDPHLQYKPVSKSSRSLDMHVTYSIENSSSWNVDRIYVNGTIARRNYSSLEGPLNSIQTSTLLA